MPILQRLPLAAFAEQYVVGEEIGSGKFAIVKRCVAKNDGCTGSGGSPTKTTENTKSGGGEVAAKFIRKSRSARFGQKIEDIELEIAILTELQHENIIQLIDVFEDVTQVILVFELMKGGELQDYIADYEHLTEAEARIFMRQILSALVHLHEKSIVHLDLKPENILLTEEGSRRIKIIDFGISRKFSEKADIKGVYGTPEFIAPEILNYEPIGYGTDLWAIGCITYTMLYGDSPFLGEAKHDTFANITSCTYDFDDTICDISAEGRDFIKRCLVKDLRKRMTAKEAFNHSWLTKVDTLDIDAAFSLDSYTVAELANEEEITYRRPSSLNSSRGTPTNSTTPTSTSSISPSSSEVDSRRSSSPLRSFERHAIQTRWKRAIRIVILHNRHKKRKKPLLKTSATHSDHPNSSCHSLPPDGALADTGKPRVSIHDENFLLAALFGAIEEGNLHSIEELFAASPIDPNQCNKHGESLLHYCAGLGQLEIFKYLCQVGADLNVVDDQEDTVIHWAARQNHPHIIRYIYEQSLSIEMINKNLETPLHVAARYGHVEAIEQLCKCGANINAIDEHGETAILIAVWHGFPKIVHILGEIGADTNIRNKEDETALHVASARGHYDCVRCLLEAGANANLRNKNSYTPLHLALKRQHATVAMHLLKAGADFELADSSGDRAIHYAARYNLVTICQWLCASLSSSTSLNAASTPNSLIQPRCLVNVPNKQGLYPLHIAAKAGHIEIVRTLCLAGSIVDPRDKDSMIPQICAIAQSHNDIADLLTRLRNERQKEEFIGQLSQVNQQPLSRVKLNIFGNCGAGKSTLIESMKCGYFSSWFRRSKVLSSSTSMLRSGKTNGQSMQHLNTTVPEAIQSVSGKLLAGKEPAASYENATKGIDAQQVYISGVGELSVWEFSGNAAYFQLYDHFLADMHCLNAIVFRLSDPVEVQLDSILFWLQFIASRQPITEPLLYGGKSSTHSRVILIATHADLTETPEHELNSHLKDLLEKVSLKFRHQFDICSHIFMMDASVAGSIGMRNLKAKLSQMRQAILQQPDLPHSTRFLDSVLTFLNLFRKASTNYPVLFYQQFKDMIRSQINPLASEDHFKELIQQLVIMGEVAFLASTTATNFDFLVLNPKWLCCDIIGSLLLLKCDPTSYLTANQFHPAVLPSSSRINGIYSIDEFQELYSDVDALDLLQLLEALSLCTQNDRSGDIEYEFPCFILAGDLDQVLEQFQYRENCVYHGIVYHRSGPSKSPTSGPILASLFPRIQASLRADLRKHSTYDVDDLHNCYKFSYFQSESFPMMMVLSVDTVSDWIEVRFCGPYETKRDAFFFSQEMLQIIERTITEVAPGMLLRKSYFSPEQLKNQRENLSLFSSSSLMKTLLSPTPKAKTTSQLLKRKVQTDDGLLEEKICDILTFGIANLAEIGNPLPGGGTIEPTLAHELHSSNLSVLTKQKLCALLDPPESIGRDWCMFGILLGMTDKLPKLDPTTGATKDSTLNATQSPTARVIEECIRNANCTIKILVEKLTELNRFDAVEVILQTGPLLRIFPLSSLPEEGTVYNDESSHTSLGVSTMSHTSSSNLSR